MAKKLTKEQQVGLRDEVIDQFGDYTQTNFSLNRLNQTGNHFTAPRCRNCTSDCIDNGPKCKRYRRTAIK